MNIVKMEIEDRAPSAILVIHVSEGTPYRCVLPNQIAAELVRRWNAHEDLVESLKGVLDAYVPGWWKSEYSDVGGVVTKARDSIGSI